MFQPNTRCELRRRSATTDRRGEYTYSAPVSVPCAVVKLDLATQKTSVRADSSGSRGKAMEEGGNAVLLFPTYVAIAEADIVEVDGEVIEVIGIFPRRDVLGRLDHKEVHLVESQLP